MRNNAIYDTWYQALKCQNPSAFKKATEYAEGLSIDHHLNHKIAADVEISHVMLAAELLEIKP